MVSRDVGSASRCQVGKSGFETEAIVLELVQPASTPMTKVSLEQTRVMHFLFLHET